MPVGGAEDSRLAEAPPGPATELPIARIQPNPGQPRTRFDETALEELAASIRANGILQPLLVRPRPGGAFEIVAGERRYRAALRAGLTTVPAVVRDLSDDDTLALALIENLIREDIGPLEAARAYRRLMDEFGWTQDEMGRRVGKSRPVIANALRLLDLPPEIQQGLDDGKLAEGHARALLGDRRLREEPGFAERQIALYREALARKWTVREVERRMAAPARPAAPPPPHDSRADPADWSALEDRLRRALGARVRLAGSASRGRIEIDFFSSDELDALLSRIEGSR